MALELVEEFARRLHEEVNSLAAEQSPTLVQDDRPNRKLPDNEARSYPR